MNKTGLERLNGFQVLRGICCLGILIAHSCHYAEVNFAAIDSGSLLLPGRVGMLNYVCIFFILSGFLTARKIHLAGGTARHHILSRFWGVYPLYWLCLSIVILMRLVVYNRVDVSYDFWKSLLILPGDHTFLCTVEWTLQFELVFWVIVTPFFMKCTRRAYPFFVIIILGLIIGCKVGWIVIGLPWLEYIIYGRDALLWLFTGSLMYYSLFLIEKKMLIDKLNRKVLLTLMMTMIVGITLMLDSTIHEISNLSDYIILVVLLFALIMLFEHLKVSENNLLVIIGNNSYVIYLIHATAFDLLFYLMNKVGWRYSIIAHVLTVVVVVVILATLSEILRNSINGMRYSLSWKEE